ncbi:MAG: hypothetical protein ACUZ8H_05275 [Candidatus Anammoxibacter sp.]
MKTFNKATQRKYIERAIQHRKADEIVQGLYWEDGKGCCVGCLAHANDDAHEALKKQTGTPIWLSKVADTLHEGMPKSDCKFWPERFITAIPKNKTSEYMDKNVKAPFLIYILEQSLKNFDHEKFPDVKESIEGSIELWKRKDFGSTEWANAARSAARSAENAARSAVWSAARSAAWSAAWSAENAARSAENAARSAENAARSAENAAWSAENAARSAAYKDYADKLVEIMEK